VRESKRQGQRERVREIVCLHLCVCVTPHLLIDRGAIRGDVHGFDAVECGKSVHVRDECEGKREGGREE